VAADVVSEVKSRLDIIDVVAGYVTLQRAGREFKGLCPFHGEKTPSFTVSPERQAWYCFGCSLGGDMFAFVQKIENIDFRQALQQLADRAGVELEERPGVAGNSARKRNVIELNTKAAAFFEHVLWKSEAGRAGRELLQQRGLDEETARRFGVGFAPAGGNGENALVRFLVDRGGKVADIVEAGLAHDRGQSPRDRFRNRLIFPIRDDRGAVIAFGGRAMGDAVPKYLNSPETAVYHKSSALFGIDLAREALRSDHQALVVEGYFDVIASHRAGIAHVVASSGTALTREQVRILSRYTESITLCFDADDAGIAAASRAVDIISAEGLSARLVVLPEGVKDPDELVKVEPGAFARVVAAAKPEWEVLLERAIGEVSVTDVEERRRAAERAVALLLRIPNAATRDLYGQQAASRLGLSADALAADVARALRGERPRPAKAAPATVTTPSAADEAPPAAPVAPPSTAEEYIAAAVLRRPSAVRLLDDPLGFNPAELANPHVRRIVEIAAQQTEGTGYPYHLLDASAQATAARVSLIDIPELDATSDEGLRTGLGDAVRTLREKSIRDEIFNLKRSENPDPDLLRARIAELAKVRSG
jgi:DNA primase